MAPSMQFSVSDRRREKDRARERDVMRLARGEVSAEVVHDANGLFSALDASRAKIVSRRRRVRI